MANTVGISYFGEIFGKLSKGHSKHPNAAVNQNREFDVMLATFNRVRPLAGLTLALVAMVGWMGLLGYVAIKLF